jgi:hypothetical protein
MEHSVVLVDPLSKQVLGTVGVDINGHEVVLPQLEMEKAFVR